MRAIIQGKTKNQRLTKKSRENTRKSGMKNHLLGWQMAINSKIWKRTFFSTIDGADMNNGFCGSSGFWFFSGEVMFFKVGFLFFGVGWCFPE